MKRKLLVCLLAGAMTISASGMMAVAEETEATTEAEETTAEDGAELSDDIYSFEVKIDGEIYKFPMSYADFTSKGWSFSGDETAEIAPNYYTSESFTKDNLTAYVSLINLGINTVTLSDSVVGGIDLDSYYLEDAPDTVIELPGGITYGVSTLDDVTSAYGTPSDTYEGDLYTKLTYDYASYQNIDLYIDSETGVLNEIDIRNFVYDEESNSSAAAEVSDEPTPEVLAYEAPAELGDDLNSFIVDFAGNLYQLPAPVSVFLENGWTLKEDESDSVVAGKDSGWVYMIKDNQKFHTLAKNYNANATTIENCFVTSVEVNVNGTNLPMTVQKGITMGISEEELIAAIGDTRYEKEESSDTFTYYNIKSEEYTTDYVQVLVNTEEDQVTGICVQYHPSSLE